MVIITIILGILPTVEDPSESAPEPNTVQMESMVETSISKDDTVTAKCERKTGKINFIDFQSPL